MRNFYKNKSGTVVILAVIGLTIIYYLHLQRTAPGTSLHHLAMAVKPGAAILVAYSFFARKRELRRNGVPEEQIDIVMAGGATRLLRNCRILRGMGYFLVLLPLVNLVVEAFHGVTRADIRTFCLLEILLVPLSFVLFRAAGRGEGRARQALRQH
ncbi:hypothetical protein [Paraburkholderia caballeronis]|uniref:hypothetical protein n=1 Tax=Paraburkholderia caballeronis TaxID=416943 RepID=UPI001065F5EE|nr:hypothetical protein [Paraburkholderia caballeronis]